jgi:ribosomal protein S17
MYKHNIGDVVFFKASKVSPIMKGEIVQDSYKKQVWIKPTRDRNNKFLKKTQKQTIAIDRRFIYR